MAPSRARNKLALRLAARKKEAEEAADPDAADAEAVERAFEMPAQPLSDLPDLDLGAVTERRINELIGGGEGGSGQPVSAYSSSSSSSFGLDDEDDRGSGDGSASGSDDEGALQEGFSEQPITGGVKRRPSTTEAKKRIPLDDDGEDEDEVQKFRMAGHAGGGRDEQIRDPFSDPEDESSSSSSGGEEGRGDV